MRNFGNIYDPSKNRSSHKDILKRRHLRPQQSAVEFTRPEMEGEFVNEDSLSPLGSDHIHPDFGAPVGGVPLGAFDVISVMDLFPQGVALAEMWRTLQMKLLADFVKDHVAADFSAREIIDFSSIPSSIRELIDSGWRDLVNPGEKIAQAVSALGADAPPTPGVPSGLVEAWDLHRDLVNFRDFLLNPLDPARRPFFTELENIFGTQLRPEELPPLSTTSNSESYSREFLPSEIMDYGDMSQSDFNRFMLSVHNSTLFALENSALSSVSGVVENTIDLMKGLRLPEETNLPNPPPFNVSEETILYGRLEGELLTTFSPDAPEESGGRVATLSLRDVGSFDFDAEAGVGVGIGPRMLPVAEWILSLLPSNDRSELQRLSLPSLALMTELENSALLEERNLRLLPTKIREAVIPSSGKLSEDERYNFFRKVWGTEAPRDLLHSASDRDELTIFLRDLPGDSPVRSLLSAIGTDAPIDRNRKSVDRAVYGLTSKEKPVTELLDTWNPEGLESFESVAKFLLWSTRRPEAAKCFDGLDGALKKHSTGVAKEVFDIHRPGHVEPLFSEQRRKIEERYDRGIRTLEEAFSQQISSYERRLRARADEQESLFKRIITVWDSKIRLMWGWRGGLPPSTASMGLVTSASLSTDARWRVTTDFNPSLDALRVLNPRPVRQVLHRYALRNYGRIYEEHKVHFDILLDGVGMPFFLETSTKEGRNLYTHQYDALNDWWSLTHHEMHNPRSNFGAFIRHFKALNHLLKQWEESAAEFSRLSNSYRELFASQESLEGVLQQTRDRNLFVGESRAASGTKVSLWTHGLLMSSYRRARFDSNPLPFTALAAASFAVYAREHLGYSGNGNYLEVVQEELLKPLAATTATPLESIAAGNVVTRTLSFAGSETPEGGSGLPTFLGGNPSIMEGTLSFNGSETPEGGSGLPTVLGGNPSIMEASFHLEGGMSTLAPQVADLSLQPGDRRVFASPTVLTDTPGLDVASYISTEILSPIFKEIEESGILASRGVTRWRSINKESLWVMLLWLFCERLLAAELERGASPSWEGWDITFFAPSTSSEHTDAGLSLALAVSTPEGAMELYPNIQTTIETAKQRYFKRHDQLASTARLLMALRTSSAEAGGVLLRAMQEVRDAMDGISEDPLRTSQAAPWIQFGDGRPHASRLELCNYEVLQHHSEAYFTAEPYTSSLMGAKANFGAPERNPLLVILQGALKSSSAWRIGDVLDFSNSSPADKILAIGYPKDTKFERALPAATIEISFRDLQNGEEFHSNSLSGAGVEYDFDLGLWAMFKRPNPETAILSSFDAAKPWRELSNDWIAFYRFSRGDLVESTIEEIESLVSPGFRQSVYNLVVSECLKRLYGSLTGANWESQIFHSPSLTESASALPPNSFSRVYLIPWARRVESTLGDSVSSGYGTTVGDMTISWRHGGSGISTYRV